MDPWAHMLEEFCLHDEPLPWWHGPARELRLKIGDQRAAVEDLLQRGLIEIVGYVSADDDGFLYAPTPEGREHWRRHVAGKRRRPPTAPPVPKYRVAQMAAARGPRDVFDLARVPWCWDKTTEQVEEFGEAEA